MSTHNHHPGQGDIEDTIETHHIIEPVVYLKVFGILTFLFILTLAVAFFDLSKHLNWAPANIVVALIIAGTKAGVIIWYFMHVKYSSRLTQLFAVSGVLWLVIMFAFTFADYFTRAWIPQPGMWNVPGGP